jgi:hypothetical protein
MLEAGIISRTIIGLLPSAYTVQRKSNAVFPRDGSCGSPISALQIRAAIRLIESWTQ